MFFDQDILFRTGSLALVWKAGNDLFKTKRGKRGKEYRAALNANLATLCANIRTLLPKMGTADGIPLRKMGILAKGIGSIFYVQVEAFERDVNLLVVELERPISIRDVDLTSDLAKKVRGKKRTLEEEIGHGQQQGTKENNTTFGEIVHYDFIAMSAYAPPRGQVEGVFGFAEEEQEQVQEANFDAHCIIEKQALDPRPDILDQGDLDMGNGMDLLFQDDIIQPPPVAIPQNDMDPILEDNVPMPDPSEIDDPCVGPPTTLGQDGFEANAEAMKTPAAARTRPENLRKRRNKQHPVDLDETLEMELPSLEVDQRPRRVRRARRRLQLLIDEETSISHKDMLARVNSIRAAADIDALFVELVKTRAPPKSVWKTEMLKRTPLLSEKGLIASAHRACGRILNGFIDETIKRQKDRPQPNLPGSGEQEEGVRDKEIEVGVGEDRSSVADAQSLNSGAAVRTLLHPALPLETIDEDRNQPQHESPVFIPEPAVDPIFPPFAQGDEGYAQLEQQQQNSDPFLIPERRQHARKSGNEEASMFERIGEESTFAEMFPPHANKKRQATRNLLLLLSMQAKKKVALTQEDAFGDIRVEKL